MPSWKHRRRLIYGTVILAGAMIVFAALTWRSDTQVAGQLIVGGVSLLSIVLTAYVGFATYEDTRSRDGGV
jgi:predicted signal transduction protein with EAL and GGDEF domain